jgi:hypothetical protein
MVAPRTLPLYTRMATCVWTPPPVISTPSRPHDGCEQFSATTGCVSPAP